MQELQEARGGVESTHGTSRIAHVPCPARPPGISGPLTPLGPLSGLAGEDAVAKELGQLVHLIGVQGDDMEASDPLPQHVIGRGRCKGMEFGDLRTHPLPPSLGPAIRLLNPLFQGVLRLSQRLDVPLLPLHASTLLDNIPGVAGVHQRLGTSPLGDADAPLGDHESLGVQADRTDNET